MAWTKGLGGQLNAIPTVANNTVIVATGTGHLRVYAAATGKLIAQSRAARRGLRGAHRDRARRGRRDLERKLMVFRLPPPK